MEEERPKSRRRLIKPYVPMGNYEVETTIYELDDDKGQYYTSSIYNVKEILPYCYRCLGLGSMEHYAGKDEGDIEICSLCRGSGKSIK